MVLEAIKYKRGSLQLLEQRHLPLETEWIDVKGVEDGWHAIRDMTVRGAPAIAIAAALSLAVDLVVGGMGDQFLDASAAQDYINAKLDHLATSRPTAVNLFDAIRRLRTVVSDSMSRSECQPSPRSVCLAVVESSEAMLEEDVAANRSMGRHGARALLSTSPGRKSLRVLTHCNTGSLATAAYGTALGVVRALHEAGALEHAYCTETRPYNQGARLTAFELVTDGLPSTLICDSAAAALMASGKVDAIVVGADRVAANGDTANKIGTYSLAVVASYHKIPFFIAAPTTTLDSELQDGSFIPIEQRDPEEIFTHFKGQRVAADIQVWNPSFDVTPASLITGIITERGLVRKNSSAGIFEVAEWLRMEAHDARDTTVQTEYSQLTVETVKDYILSRPELLAVVNHNSDPQFQVAEVGDGNMNFVFTISGPAGTVCIKQAPPYVRCVGESWPLSQDRATIEAYALLEESQHCPEHVPVVYHVDEPMCLIAMEYIAPPAVILRKGLIQGHVYPCFPDHISTFLARTLFYTSSLVLSSDKLRTLEAKYQNTEMCRLTEQVIFTDPYFNAPHNRHTSPQLDDLAEALHHDGEAKAAAAALKALFMQKRQALLHGDLHTGSIMVTEDSTKVIDPEFAFVGPIAFDVAKVIANLLLAFFAADGHGHQRSRDSTSQKQWLLDACRTVWNGFRQKFQVLWDQHSSNGNSGDGYNVELFGDQVTGGPEARALAQQSFFQELWDEVVGFIGAVIIRRLVGIAHVADMEEIADADVRGQCERRALLFGRRMLVGRARSFPNIQVVVSAADAELVLQ
jgi:5-methylthioribose kinase